MSSRVPDGWQQPLETSRWFRYSVVHIRIVGYAWSAGVAAVGIISGVGCSLYPNECGLPGAAVTGWLLALVAVAVAAVVAVVARRFAGTYGVWVNDTGVRLDRMFDTVVHDWDEVVRVHVEDTPLPFPALVVVTSDGGRWRTFAAAMQVMTLLGPWTGETLERVRQIADELDVHAASNVPAGGLPRPAAAGWRGLFDLTGEDAGHPLRQDRARLVVVALFAHPVGFVLFASGQFALVSRWPGWVVATMSVVGFVVMGAAVVVLLLAMFWIRPFSPESHGSPVRVMVDYAVVRPFSLLIGSDGRRVFDAAGLSTVLLVVQRLLVVGAFVVLAAVFATGQLTS